MQQKYDAEIFLQLVSWSLTSLFSTNMAISETNISAVLTQY